MSNLLVALLSGGMDSTVAMAQAIQQQDPEVVIACSFPYGSKHNAAETAAAANLVDWYQRETAIDIRHQIVQMPNVFAGGQSALMGDVAMPHLTYKEIAEGDGPSPTVVPFRNANLISLATSIAVVNDLKEKDPVTVVCGMHAEDARNWAYPDCTPEFLGAMANAVYIGTYNRVRLQFPLIWMMKSDIVRVGLEFGVPFHLTWSCYEPVSVGTTVMPCGKCPTCVERIQAFKVNGEEDQVEYAIPIEW